jgi:hypothetical protein
MKKVFMLAAMVIAFTGLTMAQGGPKQSIKQPVKKEATAPAKDNKTKEEKKTAGTHHHKKHAKPKQAAPAK